MVKYLDLIINGAEFVSGHRPYMSRVKAEAEPDAIAALSGCKIHFQLPALYAANELVKDGAKPFKFHK